MDPPPSNNLRALLVDDSDDDGMLVLDELRRQGMAVESVRVDGPTELKEALKSQQWDIVISDHSMPRLNAPAALALVRDHDPELPFIIVSGTIDEEAAVGIMRDGAQDYLLKGNLVRLPAAVERAIGDAQIRRARQAAEQRVRQLAEERGRLLQRLLRTHEETRKSIALELHDGPAQELASAVMFAEGALGAIERGDYTVAAGQVERGRDIQVAALREVRRIMSDLRPPLLDDLGLVEALNNVLRELGEQYQQKVSFEYDDAETISASLSPAAAIVVYRVAQEATGNALRYAEASRVDVALTNDGTNVEVRISDDGKGFDPSTVRSTPSHGLGIVGMRERAELMGGTLDILSHPGTGTTVTLRLPATLQ